MKFSHTEENRDGRHLDVLTDEENGLRIIVSRLGAELISMARINEAGEWIGFLYRDNDVTAPPEGWANHATVMGYYLHRLKNGSSLYRGHEIKGGTHGFLRAKTWHLAGSFTDESGASLKYRITPDDFSLIEYPLKVSVDITYQISADGVGVLFEFRNHEAELTAHLSFGLHPGFGATSFETFHLQMPRGLYRRYFSPGNFLSGETREIEFPRWRNAVSKKRVTRFGHSRTSGCSAADDFPIVDPPSGRWVTLDLTGVPYVTLWSDGGPFLCVEPCWGLTDHHVQRAFEKKQGIQTIPPGGELRASFSMTPQFASCD